LIIVHDQNRSVATHKAERIRMVVDFDDINDVLLPYVNVIGLSLNVIFILSLFTKYLSQKWCKFLPTYILLIYLFYMLLILFLHLFVLGNFAVMNKQIIIIVCRNFEIIIIVLSQELLEKSLPCVNIHK